LRAYIVVDLGFGDSGKGLLTDFLVRHCSAGVVVRYNGGAQAGHNVVTPDGRQHTFSQFGSGTFIPGVKTYLARQVVIHPGALLVEGEILAGKGVQEAFSRLRISDQALVITPFHQAANRIREIVRGTNRHGSCGVGVGEAVEDAQLHAEERVQAGDLGNPTMLRRKLQSIREKKYEQIVALCRGTSITPLLIRELSVFEREEIVDEWLASLARLSELGLVVPDAVLEDWLRQTETVIFEGAQGVLLDAEAGFHPFTTWSRCTAANAIDLLQELAPDAIVSKIGIMRSYAVRHGPGPLPTETDAFASVVSEHNKYNEWQGAVRYGWFDAVLARYALEVTSGVDFLAITHMDVLSRLEAWKYCFGYEIKDSPGDVFVDSLVSDGIITKFRVPSSSTLAQQAQLTQCLATVTPMFETCGVEAGNVIQRIEASIGKSVDIIASGPSAEDVQILVSFPK
jgi:adenylosuccinate synthase